MGYHDTGARFDERLVALARTKADESVAPAGREDGCRDADALGVVAVRFVELRQLADGAVDLIGLLIGWVIKEGEVGLDGGRRFDR
jgi:hypothetical protein